MDAHRCIAPTNIEFVSAANGFSSFDFVERFQGLPSLHRCLSLARSFKFKTLVIEQIAPAGLIKDENDELSSLFPNHVAGALLRLSFWRAAFKELDTVEDDALLGYAIVKQDKTAPKATGCWHLFEAVFRKYEHEHNCIPCLRPHRIHVGNREFPIYGRLYCQQNGLNKACAQVALRSLLSKCLPDGDISYRRINELSTSTARADWTPAKGLNSVQIRSVLDQLHIGYRDIDYVESEKNDPDIRQTHPFQKFLYAGVESGSGALLGFSLAGPGLQDPGKHIIPFFGHTFNKDTWVPDAEQSYFDVGGGVGYIPSESWTSSFLGHDDNFGPNYCVPRLYVKPEQVDYVSEILPSGARFSGVAAEAVSMRFVYSLHPNITKASNPWLRRLAFFADPNVQKVILRAVFATKKQYVAHLRNATDWDNSTENPQLLDLLEKVLPEALWVVEVSLPHLFPANERKLGEVVLNAAYPMNAANSLSFDAFCLARLPTRYFLVHAVTKGKPQFAEVPSVLKSHVPLLRI